MPPPKKAAVLTKGGPAELASKRTFQPQRGSWYHASKSEPSSFDVQLVNPGQYLGLGDEMRKQQELLFIMPVNVELFGSWEATEEYWSRKDRHMLEYLEDWPIAKWLVDQDEAREAYEAMQGRHRLRDQGKSVYAMRVLAWAPYGDASESLHLPPDAVESLALPPLIKKTENKAKPIIKLRATNKPVPKSKEPANSEQPTEPKSRLRLSKVGRQVDDREDDVPLDTDHPTMMAEAVGSRRSLRHSGFTAINDKIPTDSPMDSAFPTDGPRNKDPEKRSSKKRKSRTAKNLEDQNVNERSRRFKLSGTESLTPPPYAGDGVNVDGSYDFPWQNDHAAQDPEEWDDSIYDTERLQHLSEVHERNKRIVDKYFGNAKHNAQQRKNAAHAEASKLAHDPLPSSKIKAAERAIQRRSRTNKSRSADPRELFSGRLQFPDQKSKDLFESLSYDAVSSAIDAAMVDPFNDMFKRIEVTFEPNESIIKDLKLPRISIMDIARTRLQLRHSRILTNRGAQCIIDFCPDLLNGTRLLQICTETGYSNTDIQKRLGYNGTMLSDSTITKRVSSFLGRDYDKDGTIMAVENKGSDFKVFNRDAYNKYKAWRVHRRADVPPTTTTFSLSGEAARYREARELYLSNESDGRRSSSDSAGLISVNSAKDTSEATEGRKAEAAGKEMENGAPSVLEEHATVPQSSMPDTNGTSAPSKDGKYSGMKKNLRLSATTTPAGKSKEDPTPAKRADISEVDSGDLPRTRGGANGSGDSLQTGGHSRKRLRDESPKAMRQGNLLDWTSKRPDVSVADGGPSPKRRSIRMSGGRGR